MWNTLIGSELYSLRVDQYQPHLGRFCAHQNRSDHGVYEARFTRAGCSSDQQMWHLCQVCNYEATLDIFTDTDG